MSIETLQSKLQQFYKERETAQVAVLNFNGAIAVLQQLLQEEQAASATPQPPPPAKKSKVITLPKAE